MPKRSSLISRIYRYLIKLYPSDFRWRNETEMKHYLREAEQEEREQPWGLVRLWFALLKDLVTTLPREHWDLFVQDALYALRWLCRSPAFACTAVLTLALAIAANASIFSVVQAVLIRPLPYAAPDELVLLRSELPRIGLSDNWLSEPEVLDLRNRSRLFSEFAVFRSNRVSVAAGESIEALTAGLASANFLDFLGVSPELGRGFQANEEEPNGPPVAILSHDFWMRQFGGDRRVLGHTILVEGRSVNIVGVTPETFRPQFPRRTGLASTFDLWLPYQVEYQRQDRDSHGVTVLGRMEPGVSLREAQAELNTIAAQLREQWYEKTGFLLHAYALHADLTAPARVPLLVLSGSVLIVLLITCANLANLLLARNSVRSREIAIRVALGARATRLARQVLTESLTLASLGALSGLALTALALPLLKALIPGRTPGIESIALDGRVLGFTLGCSLLSCLVFSLAPILQASCQNRHLHRNLSQRDGSSDSGQFLRRLLIVSEVALAFVLLVAGGLLFQTLQALHQARIGYHPEGVLAFQLDLPLSSYNRDQVVPFFDELQARISSLPGVLAVGANMQLPLSGSYWSGTDTFYETTNGLSDQRREHFEVDQRVITPGYFRALGTALRRGRPFDWSDTRDSPPVVIIDETLAERVWPGVDPIGKRMARGPDPAQPYFFEVVGVVEHQRYQDLRSDGRPQVYYAESQLRFNSLSWVVKSGGDPLELVSPIRSLVREMDPDLPLDRVRRMSALVSEALAPIRFTLELLALFAGIGLFLAGLGVFGVVNYSVGQRTKEIAIRMALGAPLSGVLKGTFWQALELAGMGVLMGAVASLGVNRLLEGLIWGVSPHDSLTLFNVGVLCFGLALLASLFPALRAARVDPVAALRGE